ncbi:MAG: hypothetical protein UU98_C0020G0002 [Parcubacteria group bacterium GW2011_GWD2_42_14]|nr:MAG: hypothetical protein UU98_C0020G0002 [Parcubacteria group bacterium GW2011_GWD2_42_14]
MFWANFSNNVAVCNADVSPMTICVLGKGAKVDYYLWIYLGL